MSENRVMQASQAQAWTLAGLYYAVRVCGLVAQRQPQYLRGPQQRSWYNFGYLAGLACFLGGSGNRAASRKQIPTVSA